MVKRFNRSESKKRWWKEHLHDPGRYIPSFKGHHLSGKAKKILSDKAIYRLKNQPWRTIMGREGPKSLCWKGGRSIDKDGYVLITSPHHPDATHHRTVVEHRLVMEKFLGRRIARAEVIHHIDGNKTNNVIENLALFSSQSQHAFCHKSMEEIIYQLYKEGKVTFDKETGKYHTSILSH